MKPKGAIFLICVKFYENKYVDIRKAIRILIHQNIIIWIKVDNGSTSLKEHCPFFL